MGNGEQAMYDSYQSVKYNNIVIHPGSSSLMNIILQSPFQPGKHVESILLGTLRQIPNVNYPTSNCDLLYLLMIQCPNVKHVTLIGVMDGSGYENDWSHLFTTLANVNTWKLYTLSVYELLQRMMNDLREDAILRVFITYRALSRNLH